MPVKRRAFRVVTAILLASGSGGGALGTGAEAGAGAGVISPESARQATPATQPTAGAAPKSGETINSGTRNSGIQNGGAVEGVVTAESEVPLSEMVVYLESPDPARPLPPPRTEPVLISQKGAKFEPRMVIISVGQTITFVNDEDRAIEHNVFSASVANKFDLGTFPPGQSKSVTFDKAGPVQVSCSIHRYMDAVIYVAPTPYTSRVEESGKFAIEGVPPGTWVVKTWQRRKRFVEQTIPVKVAAGIPVTANIELKKRS